MKGRAAGDPPPVSRRPCAACFLESEPISGQTSSRSKCYSDLSAPCPGARCRDYKPFSFMIWAAFSFVTFIVSSVTVFSTFSPFRNLIA